MGETQVGDKIMDFNNKPQEILGVYDQGLKDVYELTFDDGSKACSGFEHLWGIYTTDGKIVQTSLNILLWLYDVGIEIKIPLIQDNKREYKLKMFKYFLDNDKNITDVVINEARKIGLHYDKLTKKFDYEKLYKTVISIKKLPEQCESRCLRVSSKNHLYITDDYTVTHNTFFAIKSASNLQLKTMFIVPTGVLQQQWIDSIVKFSNLEKEDIGIIDGSDLSKKFNKIALDKDVSVVMIQTLLSIQKTHGYSKMQDYFNNVGLVIYDESHKSGAADGFSKTVPMFRTDNIIGLSATPYRQDINKFLLDNNIGERLYESKHQNLIPEVNIRRFILEFNQKEFNSLEYLRNDYIRFLAKYNMFLAENILYLNYVADWVIYRLSQGHEIVVLFSTNKLVNNLKDILITKGITDIGVLTGKTKKKF